MVVSARGNTASLLTLLEALAQQTLTDFEAVIVDNDPPGPVRPIGQALDGSGPWPFTLRVLFEPLPGLSAGRNRGICAARGRFVAITDPDIVPEPGWLQALVACAEQEDVFAVGGRTAVEYPEGRWCRCRRRCGSATAPSSGPTAGRWPRGRTGSPAATCSSTVGRRLS
ncbi:glycosyltransferase family 2 protein [Streptomyces stramineus]